MMMTFFICLLKGQQQNELVSLPVWTNVDLIFNFACVQMSSWKMKSVHKQAPRPFHSLWFLCRVSLSLHSAICVIAELQKNKIQSL